MNIGDVKETAPRMVQQYRQYRGANQVDKTAAPAVAPAEETVALSTRSRDLLQIKTVVAQLPEVREEKVEALKARIESGAYNVNGNQISKKMVGEALTDIIA